MVGTRRGADVRFGGPSTGCGWVRVSPGKRGRGVTGGGAARPVCSLGSGGTGIGLLRDRERLPRRTGSASHRSAMPDSTTTARRGATIMPIERCNARSAA